MERWVTFYSNSFFINRNDQKNFIKFVCAPAVVSWFSKVIFQDDGDPDCLLAPVGRGQTQAEDHAAPLTWCLICLPLTDGLHLNCYWFEIYIYTLTCGYPVNKTHSSRSSISRFWLLDEKICCFVTFEAGVYVISFHPALNLRRRRSDW